MTDPDTTDRVAEDFADWARHADDSPLYQHLAAEVAADSDLVALAAAVENGPRQNIFFGAVHFLLRPHDDLARWYPSIHPDAIPPDEHLFPAFKAFVNTHREEILEIGRTRYVQTNEPRRCAALLPYLFQEADRLGEPVHLIEAGASAGLNLCMDKYAYHFTSGPPFGHSALVLTTEDRGMVPVPTRIPFVQRRVGIDLHPVDVDDPGQIAWLDALVWPEQVERRRRLAAAMAIRRSEQIVMVAGDASRVLTGVARSLPTGGPVIVFHSFTFDQFTPEQREAFDVAVTDVARQRSVARIGFEYWDRDREWPEIRIGLTSASMRPVARAHPHGAWVEAV